MDKSKAEEQRNKINYLVYEIVWEKENSLIFFVRIQFVLGCKQTGYLNRHKPTKWSNWIV